MDSLELLVIVNVSVISANNRNGYYNYTNDLSGLEKIYLGGIAAINNGKIENCHTFGSIIGNSLQYAQNLNGGGIVGWNKGAIRSVSSNQSAISVYTFSYDAKYYAGSCGGVVGFNEGTIDFATNNSPVSPRSLDGSGYGNRGGGIAGVNEGVIDKCINKGAVMGRNYIGGITGSNGVSAMIYNCINEGNFSNTKERVGSLVGYNYGVLKTSYSVASSFLIWGTGKQIGAVIGTNYGDANTCYFDSDFLADFTAVGYGDGVNVSGKTTATETGTTTQSTTGTDTVDGTSESSENGTSKLAGNQTGNTTSTITKNSQDTRKQTTDSSGSTKGTQSGTQSGEDREIYSGRHASPQAMLDEARRYIENMNAFRWLCRQLDDCFYLPYNMECNRRYYTEGWWKEV